MTLPSNNPFDPDEQIIRVDVLTRKTCDVCGKQNFTQRNGLLSFFTGPKLVPYLYHFGIIDGRGRTIMHPGLYCNIECWRASRGG